MADLTNKDHSFIKIKGRRVLKANQKKTTSKLRDYV